MKNRTHWTRVWFLFGVGLLVHFIPILASQHALAEASAMAGDGDVLIWSTKKTQEEANKAALKMCKEESSKKKDCNLRITKAIVRAEGGGRIGFGRSPVGVPAARKKALDECAKSECTVSYEITEPGLYALAESSTDKGGNGDFYLAYQYTNLDRAEADALSGCEKLTGQKCSVIWHGAIPGVYKLAPTPAVTSTADVSKSNCRPNSPSIRCSSRCTNGDCIVTYENGCKMRVQVQPRFDGFMNQWVYPSPSC